MKIKYIFLTLPGVILGLSIYIYMMNPLKKDIIAIFTVYADSGILVLEAPDVHSKELTDEEITKKSDKFLNGMCLSNKELTPKLKQIEIKTDILLPYYKNLLTEAEKKVNICDSYMKSQDDNEIFDNFTGFPLNNETENITKLKSILDNQKFRLKSTVIDTYKIIPITLFIEFLALFYFMMPKIKKDEFINSSLSSSCLGFSVLAILGLNQLYVVTLILSLFFLYKSKVKA